MFYILLLQQKLLVKKFHILL